MTNEMKQQFTLRITRANKTELVVILYEMLLSYTEEAKEAYQQASRDEFRQAIRKATGCLNELIASLHFEQEIAYQLLRLYLYVNRELALADIKNNIKQIDDAAMVIRSLLEAYQEISKQDTSEPVMQNVQTVYAGLTYGKNNLNENLSDQGLKRGFLI